MILTSFGYQLPQTPDRGSIFWPALEFDIQRLNDHTHDGSNSAKIPTASTTPTKNTAPAVSWAAVAGQAGTFRQIVTMPAGMSFDDYTPTFRLAAGHPVGLSVEKITASTFYVYINDNSQTITVIYQ